MLIYCLSCKEKRDVAKVKYEKMSNGRYRAVGKCPKCSHDLGVFVADDKVPK